MKFNQSSIMATEAIRHQDFKVYNALVEAFRTVMSVKGSLINQALLDKSGAAKVLCDGFNGTFTITLDDSLIMNAWMMPPYFDASHAVSQLAEYHNDPATTKFFLEQQKKAFKGEKFLTGTVDRANAKLGGDFSKITCPITVTRGLLSHPNSSPESAAWITMHESGHFFTYFEHLGRADTFNGALLASAEAFFKVDGQTDKIKVIADVGDLVNLTADDKDALLSSRDKDQFIMVIARSYIMGRGSQLGSSIYDITLWESLSDQFASRMAPNQEGIKAMDLLYSGGTGEYGGRLQHVVFTMLKVVLFPLLVVMTFGLALILLFINPAAKIYDEPRARMDRIRNDLVAGLKSPNLNAEAKRLLADDITEVDKLIEKVNDYRGLIEFFYTSILPSGRRQYTQLLFQRELEKLTANNLLLASAKLSNLSLTLKA